tara:strand:- start:4 stop:498 length:495 start_codon:yes stop_codon:yes gene_type:complete
MPTITTENKNNAISFTNSLNDLLDFVESVIPHIKENEYLKACNNLKVLNDLREHNTIIRYIEVIRQNIRNTNVFQEQDRRTRMKVKPAAVIFNDAHKLTHGWFCCSKCDRIVKDISNHQYSDVCIRTYDSKKVSSSTRKQTTTDIMILIHKLRSWYKKYKPQKL